MDYLQSKWKIWYHSLDVNHDGTISMADVEESRSKFANLSELDSAKAKEVAADFGSWWTKYIFRGREGDISEEMFITGLTNDYNKDKGAFQKEMVECFNKFFDVIDVNKDRSISEDEFLIAFRAYGHENVAEDKSFFGRYEPKDGLVPLKNIVESWIQFVSCDDKSKKDVVLEGFKAGV